MNFTKMVESELLALLNEAPPPPTRTAKALIDIKDGDEFYEQLKAIASDNKMTVDISQLKELIQNGSSLGRGGQRYASKPQLLRERQNFPFLDLGYSIWTYAMQNGATDISILSKDDVTMKEIYDYVNNNPKGAKFRPFKSLTDLLQELGWQNLSTVNFSDYEEHDFKSPRLRQLFNQSGGGIAINAYHNKTILETLLEITKIKSKTEKFDFNESKVLDVIYYPLEYARGKKSIDASMARGLLSCVESIISWYIDNIEKNKLIDKDVGEDASVVGSDLARKKGFQLQKGYIELLKGESSKLPSVIIPNVSKAGATPDGKYKDRELNTISTVKDCKSIAPEIYQAISQYAQALKEKSKDFAERFKTAGQAFGGIFTT